MALIHCDFFSDVLGMGMSMDVILPQTTKRQVGMAGVGTEGDCPCLFLLHGLSDDHTIWQRRTSIERFVAPLGLAVVMPNVHRSFYTDMATGMRYWTYISEEVPALARSLFRLSSRREDTFVAGLSMGGYGAFKLALRKPEAFAAAASLSGALDLAAREQTPPEHLAPDLACIFGGRAVAGSPDDIFFLAAQLAGRSGAAPALFHCCGTEDPLYPENVKFREYARGLGLALTSEEGPGEHEWGYWDRAIQRVLKWLPLPGGAG